MKNERRNSFCVPKKPGLRNSIDRPEIADIIFHRRAGQGQMKIGGQGPGRLGLLGFRFLMFWASSRITPGPVDFLEQFKVPDQQAIAGHHQA